MQKSKDKVIALLLEDLQVQAYNILAIQEPQNNPFIETTYNPQNSCFYLMYPLGKGRACFYINKKLNLASQQASFKSLDCCLIHITVKKQLFYIYNVYSQPLGNLWTTIYKSPFALLLDLLLELGEHILLEDINIHYLIQGGVNNLVQHDTANLLLDAVALADLQLLLLRGTTTQETYSSQSTIDLVFGLETVSNCLLEC